MFFIHFLANRTENFDGNSKDYYLSIGYKEFWFWALIAIFDFLGPKKGCGPTNTHMGLGPQNPTKKLTHLVDLLGHLLSRKCVSNFFDLGPHLKLTIHFHIWLLCDVTDHLLFVCGY